LSSASSSFFSNLCFKNNLVLLPKVDLRPHSSSSAFHRAGIPGMCHYACPHAILYVKYISVKPLKIVSDLKVPEILISKLNF
jgi:hypothetical protein